MAPTIDYRNTNSLWCSVLVETLVRAGVRHAVCSPGSRSTALTLALAAHPQIEAVPVLDERSAGFFALGIAKRLKAPVALVCTSGSAAANYWPAVVEAQAAQIPLLLLTADRPPEMRSCTSGQTIDQLKLYGSYVVHQVELAVPESALTALAYLRQSIRYAAERACGPIAGPVHLNVPFRDPLPPIADGSTSALTGRIDEAFFAMPVQAAQVPGQRLHVKFATKRGILVAGTYAGGQGEEVTEAVFRLQASTGWPILADALSPVRANAPADRAVVAAYDAILRSPEARNALRPEVIVCIGAWPTSKVLRAWVQETNAEILLLAPAGENRDALHGRTRHLLARPAEVAIENVSRADVSYASQWQRAEAAARSCIDKALGSTASLFEPRLLWELARSCGADTQVFVANSMPVRDAEYVMPARASGTALFCNRGANGIDGNVSTALGLAHRGPRTVAVVGDLAFLHDSNALLTAHRVEGSLTLIVVNNNGGGIFEHLPIASCADVPFRDYFLTPQQANIGALCEAHGVSHRRLTSWQELTDLLSEMPAGVRVLELPTDGRSDAADRKALFAKAAEAAKAALADRSQ